MRRYRRGIRFADDPHLGTIKNRQALAMMKRLIKEILAIAYQPEKLMSELSKSWVDFTFDIDKAGFSGETKRRLMRLWADCADAKENYKKWRTSMVYALSELESELKKY